MVVKKSEGQQKIFAGIITKLKGETAKEAKLVKDLQEATKSAEKAATELATTKSIIQGQSEQIEDNYKKHKAGKLAKAGTLIGHTLKPLKQSITDLGKQITTAESISSSVDSANKKLANAYSGAAKVAAADATKFQNAFDKRIGDFRKFHAAALKAVPKYDKLVKELP